MIVDVLAVKLDMLMNLNVVIVTPLAIPLMPSIGTQLVNANVSFDQYYWCSQPEVLFVTRLKNITH